MDWRIYEEIHSKIHALYAADATLVAALSGGLWSPQAKQDTDYPYGIYFVVSSTLDHWNSTNDPQDVLVQFSIWVKSTNWPAMPNRTDMTTTILPAFQDVFNAVAVTGTYGGYFLQTRQIRGPFPEPDDPGVMRIDLDYDVHATPV